MFYPGCPDLFLTLAGGQTNCLHQAGKAIRVIDNDITAVNHLFVGTQRYELLRYIRVYEQLDNVMSVPVVCGAAVKHYDCR